MNSPKEDYLRRLRNLDKRKGGIGYLSFYWHPPKPRKYENHGEHKKEIFKRENGICQNCGIQFKVKKVWHYGFWNIIPPIYNFVAHHINLDPTDNRLENLALLCELS